MNTSPDNLQLSKYDDDSGAVFVKQAGVYEIMFVFFIPQEISKPSVQVIINSRPVLSTIDTNQTMVYHSLDADRHISYTCYLQIKAGSKVSLSLSNNKIGKQSEKMERVNRHLGDCSRNENSELFSERASASFRSSHSATNMSRKMSNKPFNGNAANTSQITQESNRSSFCGTGMPPLYNQN